MEEDEEVTAEDIAEFKKQALVQKSILDVKRRA